MLKPVPAWAKPLIDDLTAHKEETDKRLTALEEVYTDVADIKKIVVRIWRAVKWGAPSVITAAATAGYINGDFAHILKVIFN